MNLLKKILAVVLDWPKTTVLLALALLFGWGGPRSVAAADGTEPVPPRGADATKPPRAAVQLGGLVVATIAALVVVPALSVLVSPKANGL